ncbi:MAG: DUF1631 family protein [Chromatiales bacterium]
MKVIPINERDPEAGGSVARRAHLLNAARDAALGHLTEAFKAMLDRADDVLFEFAEKSDSNVQQALYFDAMGDLRVKRAPMEAAFKDGFLTAHEQRRKRNVHTRIASPGMPSRLSLIDDGAMEEDIAVANLTDKMSKAAREELFALNKRMALLLEVAEIGSEDNPLGPKCIAEAIHQACAGLTVDLRIRLIFLKLFDRLVASNVVAMYAAVNERLAEQGVMPIVQSEGRRGYVPQPRTGAYHSGAGLRPSQAELMDILERLLKPAAGEAGIGTGHAGEPNPPCNPAVLAALTRFQHSSGSMPFETGAGGGVASVNLLKQLKGSGAMPALDSAGDMTIDIVAMLFDYILDDKNIPEVFRALIARLQIPVLKVALIDRDFFAKKSHPARRVLNVIAEAAVRATGDPPQEADVQQAVEQIVQRIAS